VNDRVFNFYPGPTALPRIVLSQIERDLLNFRGTGMSVMEISHRAPEIEFLLADTAERTRRLLGLGADTEVLLLQGGGSLQFCMIPMNFSAAGDPVDYLDTARRPARSTTTWTPRRSTSARSSLPRAR